MATLQECEQAVGSLIDRLAEVDPELRRKYAIERTVSCWVPDLGICFFATLDDDGTITEIHRVDHGRRPKAQVKLAASSDDLIALIAGRLQVPAAWATGRLKVDASMFDLLKLRSLL